MDFKVIWTDSAISDLKGICEYIGLDNHLAAQKIGRAGQTPQAAGTLNRIKVTELKNQKRILRFKMNNQPLLEIKNLHAGVEGKQILKGINLAINAGEVHAIMGPNGSGKSTLAAILAGRDGYDVTEGRVIYNGQDLLDLDPEERAREGVFLAFQYPVEIPGVNSTYFLKAALNEIRKHKGESELDAMEFLALVKEKMKLLELNEDLLKRPVNEGFSGGEKKRNEIFQMAVLEPKLAILDETDSGLDIDALKIVAAGVNKLKRTDAAQLVITHYQRLLDYIIPDFVHVLYDGRIVRTGGKGLALELEEKGYDWLIQHQAVTV